MVSNIPNYTSNNYAYGAGYLTEKGVELLILKKVSQVNPLGINNGYSFKIGRTEFLFSNPSVGGETIFSYKSSGGTFRLNHHGSKAKGNTPHFHTNY